MGADVMGDVAYGALGLEYKPNRIKLKKR